MQDLEYQTKEHQTKEYQKGIIFVLLSAICFSLGGILIKMIPWSSVTINAVRCCFSMLVIGGYMIITKHKFKFNTSVLLGAVANFLMALTFVMATKMTSAANAIVLQFTEPIFVILILWIVTKNRPKKIELIACSFVFLGILFFFFDKLTPTGLIGNLLAIFSGFAYAGVFLMKKLKNGDFESSLILANIFSAVVGIPSFLGETEFAPIIWIYVIVLGTVQCGLSYIFLSKGLDRVSPITASLTSTIEPILNPIIVAIFYGESIGIFSIIGAIIVIATAGGYNIIESMKKN